MQQVILLTQWINVFLIMSETWVVFMNMRNRMHYYLFLNCISMLLCSVSSLLTLFVETEEAYFILFMLSWAGKVGVTLTMFLFCIKLCESKLPKIISALETGFVVVSYIILVTTQKTGLFYKNLHIVKDNGMWVLEYEQGMWQTLWNITIVIVILSCLLMLGKALYRTNNQLKRKQYITIIVALLLEIVIGFLTGLPIGKYYDFNQLGFSLCAILILFAVFHNKLMDMESMAKEYIIDELSAGIIAMDASGMVAYYNKQARRIFPDIVRNERKVMAQIAESIQTGEPITVQERVYNFEERKLVHNPSDERAMYVIIDSTKHYQHLKELEREKQIADAANRAKSEFLANMSHEIRTPINAVLGMDEMILRESSESTIREYAMDIQAAGRTLLTIVNDILDLNKIEAGKMELVPVTYDVAGMVHDISNMIKVRAREKNLALRVSVASDVPAKLYGDDVKIRQILMNLLTNAVKYTTSGEVCFRVSLKQIGCKTDREEAVIRFEVEDTGIGIRPEDIDKLFMEFERIELNRNRSIEGTGLGIPIAMRLLSMMDSELKVESEYGKGSVFSFDLKQEIVEATQIGDYENKVERMKAESAELSESFVAPDAHVLIVDDNSVNRKVFMLLLKRMQMKVTEADSGYKAVELASAQKFDLIFMDHMMPGMDGIEAMEKIKAVKDGPCADVPVIVLTANAIEGSKEKYMEAGFNGYLSKPIVPEQLQSVITEQLSAEKVSYL